MSDIQELYDKCLQGNDRARKELYDRYKSRLMGLCRRYTKNREVAEDVLQESFIKIFTKFHQVESAAKLEGWLKSVVVRTAIDQYHRDQKQRNLFDDRLESIDQTNLASITSIGDDELIAMINRLPDKCRMVFNLFEIEGYAHTEISVMLGITESTSRSQLHYAKSLLKEKLRGSANPNVYEKLA